MTLIKTCPACQTSFVVRTTKIYCSPKCTTRVHNRRKAEAKKLTRSKTCVGCGQVFWGTSQNRNIYCGRACYFAHRHVATERKVEVILQPTSCLWCGDEFYPLDDQRYCSPECRWDDVTEQQRVRSC
jgi:hypothetical protein